LVNSVRRLGVPAPQKLGRHLLKQRSLELAANHVASVHHRAGAMCRLQVQIQVGTVVACHLVEASSELSQSRDALRRVVIPEQVEVYVRSELC
jgi:hypothetical protein